MTDARQDRLGAEITALSDQLVEAIRQHQLATLKEGLEVYTEVAGLLIERIKAIDELMVGLPRQPALFGQRSSDGGQPALSDVAQAISPIIETAVASHDAAATYDALNTVVTLLVKMWEQDNEALFSRFAGLFGLAASEEIQTSASEGRGLSVGRITQFLASTWTVTVGSADDTNSERALKYSKLLINHKLQIAHGIVEARKDGPPYLHDWAEVYADAYEPIEMRRFSSLGLASTLRAAKQAGFLAVRAWILFGVHEPWIGLDRSLAQGFLSALTHTGRPDATWDALILDADRALGEDLGWSWWEVMKWPSYRGARAMSFGGSYFDSALFDLLADQRASAALTQVIPTRGESVDFDRARVAADVAGHLGARLDGFMERNGAFVSVTPARIEELRVQLARISDAYDRLRKDELAEAPLLDARIREFRSATLSELCKPLRFVSALTQCADADRADSDFPTLGLNLLVAKDYFIDSDVFADVSSLGQQFGRQIVQNETEGALVRIRAASPRRSYSSDDLVASVVQVVTELSTAGHNPSVFVFGDIDGWRTLRSALPDSERQLGFDESFEFSGALCRYFDESISQAILVGDPAHLACFSRGPVEWQPDSLFERSTIVVSVKNVEADRAQSIASARVERGEISEADLEAERQKLRLQTHIQVFTKPIVEVRDPSAGVVLVQRLEGETHVAEGSAAANGEPEQHE